jgi:hypothetical protein
MGDQKWPAYYGQACFFSGCGADRAEMCPSWHGITFVAPSISSLLSLTVLILEGSLCPLLLCVGGCRAQVTLAAETCGHTDFAVHRDTWYNSEPLHCGDSPSGHVSFWDIFQKVSLDLSPAHSA